MALLAVLIWSGLSHAAGPSTPESYTRQVAAQQYGWTGAEWVALTEIVWPESHWDPCARFPSIHECGYTGSNSCGVPQANPCPALWRGRLDRTWKAQCRWLLAYVKSRYGDPIRALSYRQAHNSY